MGEVRIGTSGWSYDHWDGVFYPKGLSSQKRLAYYTREFNSVEVNYSFYRLPGEKSFLKWRDSSPDYFTFALKASKSVTHRGKGSTYLAHLFVKRAKLLEEKLGPILFQFPPTFKRDEENTLRLLKLIPSGVRTVVEFRDLDWHSEETLQLLRERCIGYCIVSAPGFKPIFRTTCDFAYLRLHGSRSWYRSSYSAAELRRFADQISDLSQQGSDVFVYFNNDYKGFAVKNALRIKQMLGA